jgi:MoaA/NifB/PqqE/SkfB family radical SAM enzyme
MVTNLYVTKRCNLRCRYCYPPGNEPESNTPLLLSLLKKIRPHNPALNLTGGEPLVYEDLGLLLREAKRLRFCPVLLSTNALLIDRIVNDLRLIDHLIFSLDSLDEGVNDMICGVKGSTREAVKNIKRCASLSRGNRPCLSVHSVITPETIDGIEEIVCFCEDLGMTFTLSPEHGRFSPSGSLFENNQYVQLINRLIDLKRRGKPITSSFSYLRTIRDFSDHHCYPFVSPRVQPDGRVYFPCEAKKERYVYLQDFKSLYKLMQQEGELTVGPECTRRCFLACFLEVEAYIRHPLAIFKEMQMREWVFGKRRC